MQKANKENEDRKDLIKKLVSEVLYMDMDEGGEGFLAHTYYKLGLQDKERIRDMRFKLKRKSIQSDALVKEEIIAIIMEEIFQKGNKELYMDMIEYYAEEFPEIRQVFKECGNNAMEWCFVYFDVDWDWDDLDEMDVYMLPLSLYYAHSEDYGFLFDNYFLLKRTFFCLYCLTYGEESAVDDFMAIWGKVMESSHWAEVERSFDWYDREEAVSCLEKIWGIKDLKNEDIYKEFMEKQRRAFSEYYQLKENDIEKFIFENIVSDEGIWIKQRNNGRDDSEKLYYHSIGDELNAICRKNHINPYISTYYMDYAVKDCFERYWIMVIYNSMLKLKTDDGMPSMEEMFGREYSDNMAECLHMTRAMVWFEGFSGEQIILQNAYYEIFDFGREKEEMNKTIENLRGELEQCRKELEQYVAK